MKLTISKDKLGETMYALIVQGLQCDAVMEGDKVIITFTGGF